MKYLGNLGIFVVCAINVLLWAVFPPADPTGHFQYLPQVTAEIFSSTAMVMMSCSFILANKPRLLEPFFGGLDQMYISHKNIAILAMVFLFGHFWIVPHTVNLTLGRVLGMTAFIGIGGSILLALAPRIPLAGKYLRLTYDQWKFLHRFVGVFFIIGMIHLTQVDNIAKYAVANGYLTIVTYNGAAA